MISVAEMKHRLARMEPAIVALDLEFAQRLSNEAREADNDGLPERAHLLASAASAHLEFRCLSREAEDAADAALMSYHALLNVYGRQGSPEVWAQLNYLIGQCYMRRHNEEPARDVDRAIDYLQRACEYYARASHPKVWGCIQHDLGSLYTEYCCYVDPSLFSRATAHLEQAAAVFTVAESPLRWAIIQSDLGLAYLLSERESELEMAIACLQRALSALSQGRPEFYWAHATKRLGLAYRFRVKGMPHQNLKDAIDCFKKSLAWFDQHGITDEAGRTRHELARAYLKLGRGCDSADLREGVRMMEEVTSSQTSIAATRDWGLARLTTGRLLLRLVDAGDCGSLSPAVASLEDALRVLTQDEDRVYYDIALDELSRASRLRGEAGEHRE